MGRKKTSATHTDPNPAVQDLVTVMQLLALFNGLTADERLALLRAAATGGSTSADVHPAG